jgi:hypothetical protein
MTWCKARLLVVLGLYNLAAAIEAIRADVMTAMGFTGGGFHCQRRRNQKIMRAMHATLGRGLLVLLNSHDNS